MTPAGVVDKKDLPMYVPFIAGGVGGTAYWAFNYPFDYVKTGWRCFFKGYVICMMRSFPVNAAAIVTYRLMQRLSNVTSH